jgi:hypothetical protein
MVVVSQHQQTRKWGFRVVNITDSENKYDTVQRILLEDFRFSSPQDVFENVKILKHLFESGKVKASKDESGIYGYTVYSDDGRVVLGEGGWQSPDQVDAHINNIRTYLQGGVKMAAIPVAKTISITKGEQAPSVRSVYTDPNTGETREYGGASSNVNLDAIKEQERLDLAAEADDNGGKWE